jgi:DNA-binding MarR family transcriptional regulator
LGAFAIGLADRIEGAIAEGVGASPSGVAALHWVYRAPGLRSEDLRRLLGISQSGAARLVSTLLAAGLVLQEPSQRDLRVMKLRTSDLGVRCVLRANIVRSLVIHSSLERFPSAWLPRLIRMTERLLTDLACDPLTGARICRLCEWSACRDDETAPCPVALAAVSHDGQRDRLRTTFGGLSLHHERRVIDGADPPIELWLEPVGAAFRLFVGRQLEVICRGGEPGRLEVERLPEGHLALYAWPGATFTVLEGGREIFVEQVPISLSMGTGHSTREKVESIHGDFQHRRQTTGTRWR